MKNVHPLKTAKRKAKRFKALLAKLGEHPVCLFCGCLEPMLLRPVTKEFLEKHQRLFEEHHVFGWMIDPVTTLALCFNCHALITEGLLQAGISMMREFDPIKFSQAVFRTQAVHFRMLSDACWRFANFLETEKPNEKETYRNNFAR